MSHGVGEFGSVVDASLIKKAKLKPSSYMTWFIRYILCYVTDFHGCGKETTNDYWLLPSN